MPESTQKTLDFSNIAALKLSVPDPLPRFVSSPHLVPFDGTFSLGNVSCDPPSEAPSAKESKKQLKSSVKELGELQQLLYATDTYAVLVGFQALDAAGKDGTIRKVFSGVNPAGCQVFSFKQPSSEELDHDFLWRINKALPERGRIGVHNRTAYEEVLVLRARPELLEFQKLPDLPKLEDLWLQRFQSIANHERHLACNGYVVIKFFLHVSQQEQNERFLDRLEEPEKHYKFSSGDLDEQAHRAAYLHAFDEALNYTSTPWAPWYVIPADDKDYMRMTVADIVVRTLQGLCMSYPEVDGKQRTEYQTIAKRIRGAME
jgi:PPK2 family polyphosphate:nucleotide phosphotransferase